MGRLVRLAFRRLPIRRPKDERVTTGRRRCRRGEGENWYQETKRIKAVQREKGVPVIIVETSQSSQRCVNSFSSLGVSQKRVSPLNPCACRRQCGSRRQSADLRWTRQRRRSPMGGEVVEDSCGLLVRVGGVDVESKVSSCTRAGT